MIILEENKDNSEILEYILKVGEKFCPMVYENENGFMRAGGTNAGWLFQYYYNKGDLDFLDYDNYLNDETVQANIRELGLDKDKFYLLSLFITHFARGVWENPSIEPVTPSEQVKSFSDTVLKELKVIDNCHAEFTGNATITLKIGKKKIVVDDAVAIAYIGSMTSRMYRIAELQVFLAQKDEENDINLSNLNICTYSDDTKSKDITVNYNDALFRKEIDIRNPFQKTTTHSTYLIGHFATMFDYFLKDIRMQTKKSYTNSFGDRITISKYRLICRLIGLTRLTQNKKLDEEFLEDEGDKVKGYITALKKAKIKTLNRFYD